jgi:hypothetical protein
VSATAPLKVGDRVCVHGKGFGKVVKIHMGRDSETDRMDDYCIVEIPRRDYHEGSRRVIEWTDKEQVRLDVYPPHLSRSL